MILAWVAVALCTIEALAQILATVGVSLRLRARPRRRLPFGTPPVSLLRPVRGIENHIADSIETSFLLTYPVVEILFCVDDEDDPVVPIVRRAIDAHPERSARLLVGKDHIGPNPKLNNLVKGWREASHGWIIMSDSNALLPPDFIEALFSRWRDDTGMMSTAATVIAPDGFAADLECAFVNSSQARWLLFGDMLGLGFALGRTLMWQREALEDLGGLAVLARETAEDIASTKALRGTGRRPRMAQHPVPQAIGRRQFSAVWRRQVRWARLRRAGVPLVYAAELLNGPLVAFASVIGLAVAGLLPPAVALAYVAIWYGLEAMLTVAARWPMSWRIAVSWVIRDLLLPVIWIAGLVGSRFEWRGSKMTVTSTGG